MRSRLSAYRHSAKDQALWSASGTLYGARLLSVQQRREIKAVEGELALGNYEVEMTAHVLTNLGGIHALSTWQLYNQRARIEQRTCELGQISVGVTAVDDLGAMLCPGRWAPLPIRCCTRFAPRPSGEGRSPSGSGPGSSVCRPS